MSFKFQTPMSISISDRLLQISFYINSNYLSLYYIKIYNFKNIYGYLFNNFFLNFEFNFFINDIYSFNSSLMHKALKNNYNLNFF